MKKINNNNKIIILNNNNKLITIWWQRHTSRDWTFHWLRWFPKLAVAMEQINLLDQLPHCIVGTFENTRTLLKNKSENRLKLSRVLSCISSLWALLSNELLVAIIREIISKRILHLAVHSKKDSIHKNRHRKGVRYPSDVKITHWVYWSPGS